MAYFDIGMDLTDEHLALKEQVHKFSLEVLRPASLELDKMTPEEVIAPGSLYWDCMKKMYKNSYHTTFISEEFGGMGLDALANHIFWEEMGYGSSGLAISLACTCMTAFFAELIGDEKLIDDFVIPFTSCTDASVMGCWAITEPEHGTDNLMPGTTYFKDPKITHQVKAKKKGDKWVLNGQKAAWVSDAPVASCATVFVNIDPSMGMSGGGICLANLSNPGVSKGKSLDKMGQRELPQGEIYFDDVELPNHCMIVDPDSYESMTELTLAHANALMSAVFTGVGQAALDLAKQYVGERIQGGNALKHHQWVQKKIFDMFVRVESSRAMSRAAMIYSQNNFPPPPQFSIAAKVHCTENAFQVCNDAVQIFGGGGVSKEFPIEKLFRDARAALIEDGSNDTLSITGGNMLLKT